MSGSRPAPGIIVINPNSSRAVTAGMDRAIENLRRPDGPAIRCVTLAEGPPGIETDAQVRAVMGRRELTAADFDDVADMITQLVLKGCGIVNAKN